MFLDHTYGLDKIYSAAEIEKAKQSPSFPREYELQYLGIEGNVFSTQSIELCQKVEYDPTVIVRDAAKLMGVHGIYEKTPDMIRVHVPVTVAARYIR